MIGVRSFVRRSEIAIEACMDAIRCEDAWPARGFKALIAEVANLPPQINVAVP